VKPATGAPVNPAGEMGQCTAGLDEAELSVLGRIARRPKVWRRESRRRRSGRGARWTLHCGAAEGYEVADLGGGSWTSLGGAGAGHGGPVPDEVGQRGDYFRGGMFR